MAKLTIGFSKPKSKFAVFGRAIMIYQGTPYSHCYVKYETSSEVFLIAQASKGMVNFMSVPAFELHNSIVQEFDLDVTAKQFSAVKKKSMESAGLPYSILQICGILVADILGLKVNPFDTDKDTFVCSEYLGQILLLLDYEITKDLSLLTPKDVHEIMEKKHAKVDPR